MCQLHIRHPQSYLGNETGSPLNLYLFVKLPIMREISKVFTHEGMPTKRVSAIKL